MSFNIEDPLAGILSDGSDDSFFNDDILGKKKPLSKKATPILDKKSTLFNLEEIKPQSNLNTKNDDLFGPNSKKVSEYEDRPETTTNITKTASPTPFKRTISKETFQKVDTTAKTSSEKFDITKSPAKTKLGTTVDKLDILEEFSLDTKNAKLNKAKKSNTLLDDILGGPPSNTSSTLKKTEFDLDSLLGNNESKQIKKTTKSEPKKHAVAIETPKAPKQISSSTKPNQNWLGIFQDKDETIEEEEDDDDMPAWLGGGTKKKKNIKPTKIESEKEKDSHAEDVTKEIEIKSILDVKREHVKNESIDGLKLDVGQEDVTVEGATLYLQQQESQLMVAMQLKAQDEKLAAMQMRQKESQRLQREVALSQHEQVEAMLNRQAVHRKQMQAVITAHQERITQRIKALLGDSNPYDEKLDEEATEYGQMEQKESPFSKERKQLLQLVQSLQDNHDKEIDLMETSYRRQLAFLEVSFSQAEERMKDESDKLVTFYNEKIRWLDEHHQLYKKMSEDNLNSLTKRHKVENDMIRQQHLDNIKVLQEHHAALMENVKTAVKQEQVLIKDSAGFSSDLRDLLANVKESNEKCGKLHEQIETLTKQTQDDSERSLQIREKQISEMIQQLKRDREIFEKEKCESKDLVNMLEARLKQMTTMIEEETASLRQRKMEFEFEKATFSKQTEFAKNMLKKQDEEIKILKEDIQKEHQEKISRLEEERSKAIKDSAMIAKEKVSIQSLKLELEKTKAELQAQFEEMSDERTKLNAEKQEVHMEEQRVISKSRDLDLLAKTAMEKQSQADKKYSEAEFLQRKYEDRIRRIQEHVVSLNNREKQIAKEKVSLSRERLSLHNDRKEIESRQECSLCRSSRYDGYDYNTRGYANLHPPINVIEADIAQLMGRVRQNDVEEMQEAGPLKDYMDPRLMMLRLDVQQVISNLDQTKKDEERNEAAD